MLFNMLHATIMMTPEINYTGRQAGYKKSLSDVADSFLPNNDEICLIISNLVYSRCTGTA
jgi:hypothetical protein